VKNLDESVTEEVLRKVFEPYGNPKRCVRATSC
jgi:RNA recognition motif-containing protein